MILSLDQSGHCYLEHGGTIGFYPGPDHEFARISALIFRTGMAAQVTLFSCEENVSGSAPLAPEGRGMIQGRRGLKNKDRHASAPVLFVHNPILIGAS
jgi:hypothetical protein